MGRCGKVAICYVSGEVTISISKILRDTCQRLAIIAALLVCVPLATEISFAQEAEKDPEVLKEEKRRSEAKEAIDTLANLISGRREQTEIIEKLKIELKNASEEATQKEVNEKIEAATAKLDQINAQLTALSTGVADDEYSPSERGKFDLQAELMSLAEPVVKMMKAATENARQIEKLRGAIAQAERQHEVATRALDRLRLLKTIDTQSEATGSEATQTHLTELQKTWGKRLEEAADLRETAEQQLALREEEQSQGGSGVGNFVTDFLRTRGFNFLVGLLTFAGVFGALRLVAKFAGMIQRRQGIPRSIATRVASLVFQLATIIIALVAMLAVFNYLNDWLLLGLAAIFALALAWVGVKMLPALVEQTTLLLNLGAVQESERVMLNGVPWRVELLDFYTDLVNPALEGGTFTLPVRELVGLHSRPAAVDEAWFPTEKHDWVQLRDGRVGKVVIQTPELVQLVDLGGSRLTYATSAFLEEAPRNLSSGFRAELTFGIDYRHQRIATDEIPQKLEAHVKAGLNKLIGPDELVGVQVELLRAGDSSIDYEVEADVRGTSAPRYEEIEREMARLLVEACNVNNWVIPFPQLVLHGGVTNSGAPVMARV